METTMTMEKNGNHNRNGNGNGNRNINDKSKRSSVGQTRQRSDPPIPTGNAYFWKHGKTVNDLRTSGVCRYPSNCCKRTAMLENSRDGIIFGI